MLGRFSEELGMLLNVRRVDNVFMNGDGVEVYRGTRELEWFLKPSFLQESRYLFHEGHKFGGNHYHEHKFEIISVFDSDIDVYLKDPRTNQIYSCVIPLNHRFNLVPMIAHALFKHTPGRTEILEHTCLEFDPANPKNDTFDFPVIDRQTGQLI